MNDNSSNNFWLFLDVLARRRNLVFTLVILVTIGAVIVSLMLPKWYTAKAQLLPPKSINTQVSGFGSMAEALSVTTGLSLPIMATPSDVYASILKSRTVTKRIIESSDLKAYYKIDKFEEIYDALMFHTKIEVSEDGFLIIAVEDKDPAKAAEIANAFVDELDNVNKMIVSDRIEQLKTFVEGRLSQVMLDLDSARAAFESFQMKFKAVDFDQQTRLAVEQAIKLKVQLAEIELERKMDQLTLGKENPKLAELEHKKNIIQTQLSNLENENSDSSFFSLPVSSIPALKGEYEMLYSRVKVAEAIYKILLEQRENAKIKEFEKMPTVTVLDRADIPQLKSRPQRSIIVLVSFALSFIFSIFLAVILEYFRRLKNISPENYNRGISFLAAYFGWLPGVKNKNNP